MSYAVHSKEIGHHEHEIKDIIQFHLEGNLQYKPGVEILGKIVEQRWMATVCGRPELSDEWIDGWLVYRWAVSRVVSI